MPFDLKADLCAAPLQTLSSYRSGIVCLPRMDPWDTDSEDSCDWGDSSEEASSPEEDEADVKFNTE